MIKNFDVNTFVDGALAFVICDTYLPDLCSVLYVRTSIGLQVKTHDLNRPDLLNSFRQQVDLGADQVRDLEGFVTRQDFYPHIAPGLDFAVDCRFDDRYQILLQSLELEIHAPFERLHVATGD